VSDLPPPVPAATVIVVRDGHHSPSGDLEVLLLQRSDVGAFPGFWVFPGGRVDDDDAGDDDLSKAVSAAIRESNEEVGLRVEPDGMFPFSHWTPPSIQPRRFATWFFVALWQGDEVRIDGREIVDYRWMSPAEGLAAQLKMAPPTIVSLHELNEAGTFAAARPSEVPRYLTRPQKSAAGDTFMVWSPDAAYESGDLDAPGPRSRLHYNSPQTWFYEKS
jgi:8-oxo-dGTP pyrophosphatase MutT (NUDIX family)